MGLDSITGNLSVPQSFIQSLSKSVLKKHGQVLISHFRQANQQAGWVEYVPGFPRNLLLPEW